MNNNLAATTKNVYRVIQRHLGKSTRGQKERHATDHSLATKEI